MAASFAIAGRHLDLLESESAAAVAATVRSYRERMADYAFMRALEVWYDKIDVERLLKEAPEDAREQIEKNKQLSREELDGISVSETGGAQGREASNQGGPATHLPS